MSHVDSAPLTTSAAVAASAIASAAAMVLQQLGVASYPQPRVACRQAATMSSFVSGLSRVVAGPAAIAAHVEMCRAGLRGSGVRRSDSDAR